MEFVGAWLRQLGRAGMAAAIVPIAIVAALVVAVVGAGGLGGLGSLGQLVTGPEVSPLSTDAAQADREGGRERDLALVAPSTIVAAVRPAAEAPAAAGETPAPAPQRVLPRRLASNPPLPPVPPPPPPPPQVAPPPPPARAPTARDRAEALVGGLAEVVDDVGTGVGEVIGNLGEATGEIIDGPPPAR